MKTKMADAEARREARRRKILGNSANRLKLITGEHNGSIHDIPTTRPVPVPPKRTEKHDISNIFLNSTIQNHLQNHLDSFEPREIIKEQVEDVSTNHSFTKYSKICIVVLAIITRILFTLDMQYVVGNSVFLPFLVTELTAVFLLEQAAQSNVFINTFLLLSSLPPNQILFATRIFKFIEKVTSDFGLYFMTFTVVHLCLDVTLI